MMMDWAMSLFAASLVSLLMLSVVVADVHAAGDQTIVGQQLSEAAGSFTQRVDEDVGLGIAVNDPINFTNSPSGYGLVLPTTVNGIYYTLTITPEFVLMTATVQGSAVSRESSFAAPLNVWPTQVLRWLQLEGNDTTGPQMHSWDQQFSCYQFASGDSLLLEILSAHVDGTATYIAVLIPPTSATACAT